MLSNELMNPNATLPRPPLRILLDAIDRLGRLDGWIGGGCARAAVVKAARQCMADGRSRLVSIASWGFLELVHSIQEWVFTDLPDGLGFDTVPWWWPLPWLALAGLVTAFAIQRLPGHGGHVPADGLKAGGADVVWIETMSAPEEVHAAAAAAIANDMPYVATCSFDTAGRTKMKSLWK